MKKFLLLAFLTFTPLFAINAANITEKDCTELSTFLEEDKKENGSPVLPTNKIVQDSISIYIKGSWKNWLEENNTEDKKIISSFTTPWKNAIDACEELKEPSLSDKQKQNLMQQAKLNFELAISKYRDAESRARMPFIRHGNVLPGPKAGENGSDYVEKKFIPKFVNGTLIFLMSLSVLMVIIGGLMFIFSAGDSDSTSRAKTTIMWSIVGVVITLLAYTIVQFIIGIDFTL